MQWKRLAGVLNECPKGELSHSKRTRRDCWCWVQGGCWSECFSNNWSIGIFLLHFNRLWGLQRMVCSSALEAAPSLKGPHRDPVEPLPGGGGMGKWAAWMHHCQICGNCLTLSCLWGIFAKHLVEFIGQMAVLITKGGQTRCVAANAEHTTAHYPISEKNTFNIFTKKSFTKNLHKNFFIILLTY